MENGNLKARSEGLVKGVGRGSAGSSAARRTGTGVSRGREPDGAATIPLIM